jgi:hypothetical protein
MARSRTRQRWSWLLAAAGVFTVSLFLRTVDAAACVRFPSARISSGIC